MVMQWPRALLFASVVCASVAVRTLVDVQEAAAGQEAEVAPVLPKDPGEGEVEMEVAAYPPDGVNDLESEVEADPLDGVNDLAESIRTFGCTGGQKDFKSGSPCKGGALSDACEDAAEFLETLFGGLNKAKFVASSTNAKVDHLNEVSVTLTDDHVLGEFATKARVPYDVLVDKHAGAKFSKKGDALVFEIHGVYFAPPRDARDLLADVMAFKDEASQEACKIECPNASIPDADVIAEAVVCESCVAYEWYKAHKEKLAVRKGKMAKILAAMPFHEKAYGVELEQGAWTPSNVGDKKRRRIIYAMLTADPIRIKKMIFGHSPADFGAPAQINGKGTYGDGRYMSVETEENFHGDVDLADMFKKNRLSDKSLSVGKATLFGRPITTDQPPESDGITSDINVARLVASGRQELRDHNIFVRPAKSVDILHMLKICAAAQEQLEITEHPWNIDTGCTAAEGSIIWRGPD